MSTLLHRTKLTIWRASGLRRCWSICELLLQISFSIWSWFILFLADTSHLMTRKISVLMNVGNLDIFLPCYTCELCLLGVFNTECHPFKAPAPKSEYPTGTYTEPQAATPVKSQSGEGPAISPNPFLPPIKNMLNIPWRLLLTLAVTILLSVTTNIGLSDIHNPFFVKCLGMIIKIDT